jgi:riboflavin synthase
MFTGLIEEVGVISALIRGSKSLRISVYVKKVLPDTKLGDSIAVNGICLTVVEMGRNHFAVDVVEETLRRSSLAKIKIGDAVNLERAVQLTTRLGGHLMTGHIDGVAEIKSKIIKETGFELLLSLPRELKRYIAPKGSIGVEGVSLTVAKVTPEGIQVAIVPHTAQQTTLGQKNVGEKVNLEIDILAKYLESLLQIENSGQSERVMMNAGFMPLGIWEN